MNEFLEQLRAALLRAGVAENSQPTDEQIVAALKSAVKPAYQLLFEEGHGVAMAQQQVKIDRLTSQLEAMTSERDRIQGDLQTMRNKAPDVESVRQELQAELDRAQADVERLTGELKSTKQESQREIALEKLRARLTPVVIDGYEEVLVDRKSTRELVSFGEDGKMTILRPGKTTPYAGDLDAQLTALTTDLTKGLKPSLLKSPVGGNGSADENNDEGGSGDKKDLFTRIAEDAKKQTGNPIQNPEQELNRRLGTRL